MIQFDNSDMVTTSPAMTGRTTHYYCNVNFDRSGECCSDGVSSTIWGD